MTPLDPDAAVYLLDKRRGISSRRAAEEVARAHGFRRYGHAGTLDPDATGVLVVMLGRATRLSRFLSGQDKTYSFVLRLGVTTDTDDGTGEVIAETRADHVTDGDLTELLASGFTGEISQQVPRFSAVRVEGRRAFRGARRGDLTAEMPVRTVRVEDWEVGELAGCTVPLSVKVSAGTYVRSLARDIGERLGTGGIALDIRRTSSGDFRVDECSTSPDDPAALLDMTGALRGFAILELDDDSRNEICNGRRIRSSATGTLALTAADGRLVAVGQGDGSEIQPVCVLEAP